MQSAGDVPVILVCSRAAKRTATDALANAGVEVMVATGRERGGARGRALDELGSREIQSVLLEGGPHLAGVFLEAGEIDEARMFIAPMLLGGRESKGAVEAQGVESIADAVRARVHRGRAHRRRRADHRPPAGVVMFTGLVADHRHGRARSTTAACAWRPPSRSGWPRATRWR